MIRRMLIAVTLAAAVATTLVACGSGTGAPTPLTAQAAQADARTIMADAYTSYTGVVNLAADYAELPRCGSPAAQGKLLCSEAAVVKYMQVTSQELLEGLKEAEKVVKDPAFGESRKRDAANGALAATKILSRALTKAKGGG